MATLHFETAYQCWLIGNRGQLLNSYSTKHAWLCNEQFIRKSGT